MHIAKCYGVAAQFEGCREKIQETPAIVKDVCRILYYKVGRDHCFQWQGNYIFVVNFYMDVSEWHHPWAGRLTPPFGLGDWHLPWVGRLVPLFGLGDWHYPWAGRLA